MRREILRHTKHSSAKKLKDWAASTQAIPEAARLKQPRQSPLPSSYAAGGIAHKCKDFTHKLSRPLIREDAVLVVENLSLQAMAHALELGQAVNDLGYGIFLQQWPYQALWANKLIREADRCFTSSKTGGKCGLWYKGLSWSERVFTCPSYGFQIDRNHHAAINLKNYGLKQ